MDLFERQPEPGERLPHRGQPGHDPVRLGQPLAMLGQRGVRNRRHAVFQGAMQRHELARDRRLMRPRRDGAGTGPPLPRLDHEGNTDLGALGSPTRGQLIRRENTVPQVLRLGLTTTPRHLCLQHLSEHYKSHLDASLKAPIAVPPSAESL